MAEETPPAIDPETGLARRLGLFDATMLVMGGIIGAGIFVNPAEVARHVSSPPLIVAAWLIGGAIALVGAFVYAELAARRPRVGGQYAYIRDAWGPLPAFLYGWALLLVIQSGGMAAVAIIFARHAIELTGAGVSETPVAPAAPPPATAPAHDPGGLLAALTPVMFAYGGWQTASFVAAEMRDPRRDLARGLLLGVAGVVLLYAAVAFVCVRALGPEGLAASDTPTSAVMRLAFGEAGGRLIAAGIAISALGFLSQSMLTAPRVYFAMAEDGLFFRAVAKVSPRTRAPVAAILLQGAVACLIAASGAYGQILSYVVSVDFIFFGLTGAALIVFRRRAPRSEGFRAPLHPWSTLLFVAACWIIVAATVASHPVNSLIGFGILALGVPACLYWQRRQKAGA